MRLVDLRLRDFRNYAELAIAFSARKIILLGNNAQGKTNLLEAIALLGTGRSPGAQRDAEMVRWGADFAVIHGEIARELTTSQIDMLLRANGRRAIRVDGVHQKRLSDLLGRMLVVVFRAEDLQLVKGGPAERRGYLDGMLAQLSRAHHQQAHEYDRLLAQRNSLLRSIGEGAASAEALAPWNEQLIRLAIALWRRRTRLMAILAPQVAHWYGHISEQREVLSLRYAPSMPLDGTDWEAPMRLALREILPREIARGQTLLGPHRDDFELLLDERSARTYGSQGQQRTIVLALKLAELAHVRQTTGEAPILLLDDVLAELDLRRQNALLNSIESDIQTFVTSTHLNDFSAEWLDSAEIHQVHGGTLTRLKSPGP